ncbi:MAG: membrane protein insertase YidC [bacterium]|nr:membrane protein insertase YidC [bacterium]
MNLITAPFSALLMLFYNLFGSYGWAILAFGVVLKLITLPFQMKSTKSMMQNSMLQPRMKELEKKYANDKQKYQEELAKLYQEAKINPMSGCLWSLLPLPILIALYAVVRRPLSNLMGLAATEVTALTTLLSDMGLYTVPAKADAYVEMTLANVLHENFSAVVSSGAVASFADKLKDIDFNFLGLNLTMRPKVFFWNYADTIGMAAAIGLFLIPFISALLSWLQSKVSQTTQPTASTGNASMDAQAQAQAQTSKSMMLWMPLMSVYICFIMPAAMGIYWIEQSVLGIVQQVALNKLYKGQIDEQMAEFNAAQQAREAEIERKRQETERLRAEGKTQVNASTSKKRLAAKERNEAEQKAAARRAAERSARGLDKEVPASQVGNRRYARGRAYVEDRYENVQPAAGGADAPVTEEINDQDS